jgi:hypothetical protein
MKTATKSQRLGVAIAALVLALASRAYAQSGLALDWWTEDGGGGTLRTSQFTLSGTIGQPDAGSMGAVGTFTLEGGFWPGLSVVGSGAVTRTWVGPVNDDWFNANNWSPAGVPGPYDTILLNGGTIHLTAPVTIGGQVNWSGGTLMGSALTITGSGVLNISGGVTLGSALSNAGTVNWLGGGIYLDSYYYPNAGPVVNLAGGLWSIQCDQSLSSYNYSGTNAYFLNRGTVQKTAGTGGSYVFLPFYNSGVVTAVQGTLNFQNGGPIAGSFSAASGAVVAFGAGSFVGAGAVVSGPGVVRFVGGNLLLVSNVIPNLALTGGTVSLGNGFQGGSITNLTVAGSTLSGSNTVSGAFNWSGGTLAGPLTVGGSGVLNISGSVTLDNALTNAGTVNWLGGGIYLDSYYYPNAGPVVNLAGGLWSIQCDQSLSSYNYAGTNAWFVNGGTVQKTAGMGGSYIFLPFYNSGVVTVAQGTLNFQNGGPIAGSFSAASGAVIAFGAGSFVGAGAVVSGPGVVRFVGGNLLLVSNVIPNLALTGGTVSLGSGFQGGSITNLTVAGSTLSGSNTVSGTFNWSGGTLAGPLTVGGSGVLNISGSVTLENALTNAGTVNWLGGGIYLDSYYYPNAGPVVNLAGGLWSIQCDQSLSSYSYSGADAWFVNGGTVQKTAGSGGSYIFLPFYNSGVVTVAQGTLNFQNGGPIAGSFSAASGAAIAFGSGSFIGAGAVASGPGVVRFSGGNLLLVSNVIPNLALTGGTVSLGNGFQGGSITNLTLAGSTLSGSNTVSGTFNWSGGTLAGPLTVGGSGVLNISGSVTLDNALTNAGTVNWLGGGIYLDSYYYPNAGPVVNLAGGLWSIQCDQSLSSYNYSGTNAWFVNGGTVQKTAGTGGSYVYIPFYNSGGLSLLSGLVSFSSANAYTQTGATLNFGLAGTGRATPLQINGNLRLDGTLSASLMNNYAPQPGDTIPLISCGTLTSSFNYLNLPLVGNHLAWRLVYVPSAVSLQVVSNDNVTAQIIGSVTDTNGAPVANVTVFAYTTNSDNSLFLSSATDSGGSYALKVANGVWRLGVQGLAARGYYDLPTRDVVVSGSNQVVDFVVLRNGGVWPVSLSVTRSNAFLVLSWPASAEGWLLHATTNLASGGIWTEIRPPYQTNGVNLQFTEPAPTLKEFYRLHKP